MHSSALQLQATVDPLSIDIFVTPPLTCFQMQYHPYTEEEQEVVMQTEKELMAAKRSGKVLPASVGGAAEA